MNTLTYASKQLDRPRHRPAHRSVPYCCTRAEGRRPRVSSCQPPPSAAAAPAAAAAAGIGGGIRRRRGGCAASDKSRPDGFRVGLSLAAAEATVAVAATVNVAGWHAARQPPWLGGPPPQPRPTQRRWRRQGDPVRPLGRAVTRRWRVPWGWRKRRGEAGVEDNGEPRCAPAGRLGSSK